MPGFTPQGVPNSKTPVGPRSFTNTNEIGQTGGSPVSILADVGLLLIAGFVASVVATSNQNVQADVGAVAAAGFAPSVATPVSILSGVGSASFAGLSPSLSLPVNAQADLGQITATGLAPIVLVNTAVGPDVGTVSAGGFSPVVLATQSVNLATDVGLFSADGYAPDVAGDPVANSLGGFFVNRGKWARRSVVGYEPTVTVARVGERFVADLPKAQRAEEITAAIAGEGLRTESVPSDVPSQHVTWAIPETVLYGDSRDRDAGIARPAKPSIVTPAKLQIATVRAEAPSVATTTPSEEIAPETASYAVICDILSGLVATDGLAPEITVSHTRPRPSYLSAGEPWTPETEDADDDLALIAALYAMAS